MRGSFEKSRKNPIESPVCTKWVRQGTTIYHASSKSTGFSAKRITQKRKRLSVMRYLKRTRKGGSRV